MPRRSLLVVAGLCVLAASTSAQDVVASVGSAQEGRLEGRGTALPLRGTGYHWETNRGNPEAHFGTPALVAAIVRAAGAVARAHPGSDLAVHDISLPGGGPIRGHGSHRSGRDVDIAYYAVDPEGRPIDPTTSVWFVGRGIARDLPRESAPRMDAARTWSFLAAMLEDESIEVQYVFAAPGLQQLLLARARSSPLAARARAVLRTPHGRRVDPHADHFHVRIHCPAADVARGCLDAPER